MISKSKTVIIAAVLTAGAVSPVIAQEADHTGSQMPYYYDSTGAQVRGSWGPQDAVVRGRSVSHSRALYGDVPSRHSRRVQ